jgi:hypothetical protein
VFVALLAKTSLEAVSVVTVVAPAERVPVTISRTVDAAFLNVIDFVFARLTSSLAVSVVTSVAPAERVPVVVYY